MDGQVASVATGQALVFTMPFTGRVINVQATVSGATSTADATVTTSINGTAIPGGAFLVTNGTAANTGTGLQVSGFANQGDLINIAFSGSGAGGGPVGIAVQARRGF
jgi:hypothetical protein